MKLTTMLLGGLLVLAACGDDDSSSDGEIRPFSEVQAGDLTIDRDALDPTRAILRVETTEPMICAVVWGETEEFGRFNNSLAMSGTGIIDHDVFLPDVEPGRTYHYVVQGTTADGTLYRSEPATFTLPAGDDPVAEAPSVDVGDNLALDATVSDVSSEFSDAFQGELAIDGDMSTEWSTAGDGDGGWIAIDLGSPQDVAAVEFVTRSMADGSAITSTFTVAVDDGDPLGPFATSSPAASEPATVDITGQVLRFDVTESSGGNVGAAEIRVFAPPG